MRIQILGKESLSSLEEIISLVMAEESRRSVMLEPKAMDRSALAVQTNCREPAEGQ